MDKNLRHGFTLIELLVVIAIIALLVSILLPSLNTARDLAKQVLCTTRARQIGTANQMYATDNGDYNVSGHFQIGTQHWWWVGQLRPYVGEEATSGRTAETFICPSDTTRGGVKSLGAGIYGLPDDYWICRSFGVSVMVQGRRISDISNASSVILAGGVNWWELNTNYICPVIPYGANYLDAMPRDRHGGGVSMVMLDGHVTTEQPDTLYPGGENENYWDVD